MTMTIDISPGAQPRLEAEAAKNGQAPVIYLQAAVENSFLPETGAAKVDAGWDALIALIEGCQMDTGITDLAHQHDHYIHGKPKRH